MLLGREVKGSAQQLHIAGGAGLAHFIQQFGKARLERAARPAGGQVRLAKWRHRPSILVRGARAREDIWRRVRGTRKGLSRRNQTPKNTNVPARPERWRKDDPDDAAAKTWPGPPTSSGGFP